MEIEINEKNKKIILDVLSNTIEIIQKIGDSEKKEQSDKKRLVLLDLIFRQYPNLNSVGLLFSQYFILKNYGNYLPIGLIMRCSLEDMLYAKYLLSFKNDPSIFENEIIVQSKNAISEYLEYIIEREPDYWMCSDDKKEEIKAKNIEDYNKFKIENPKFFDESGKIKNFRKLRKDIPNIRKYFDSDTIEKHGPCNMFKRIRSIELNFSYIYFEYKFYCLFEHYSFHTRKIMELNKYTLGHLALSIEFILRSLIDILEYLNVDSSYLKEIKETTKSLKQLLKHE
jgi:hypothetical protein